MELKEKLLDSHLAFEEQSEVNETIQDFRSRALRVFEKNGFPTKKNEAWKYTSLGSLINKDYALFPRTDTGIELKDVKPYFLYEIDTYKIVFNEFGHGSNMVCGHGAYAYANTIPSFIYRFNFFCCKKIESIYFIARNNNNE